MEWQRPHISGITGSESDLASGPDAWRNDGGAIGVMDDRAGGGGLVGRYFTRNQKSGRFQPSGTRRPGVAGLDRPAGDDHPGPATALHDPPAGRGGAGPTMVAGGAPGVGPRPAAGG
jgi:hypothetical protein